LNGSVKEFSSGNGPTTFRTPTVSAFMLNADNAAFEIDEDGVLRAKDTTAKTDGDPVGTILPWASVVPRPGFLPLLGAELGRATYPDLWEFAANSGNIVSEAAWQIQAAAQPSVGHFSTGNGTTTFRLPKRITPACAGNCRVLARRIFSLQKEITAVPEKSAVIS
jgi:hypothetical protein